MHYRHKWIGNGLDLLTSNAGTHSVAFLDFEVVSMWYFKRRFGTACLVGHRRKATLRVCPTTLSILVGSLFLKLSS